MEIDQDRVPRTFEEAVQMLADGLADEEQRRIRELDPSTSPGAVHHTVGRYLRNNWSLWDKDLPLVKHFQETMKIWHADDMSGLILEGVIAKVCGEEYDPQPSVDRYHEHWRKSGLDPFTGEEL